MHRLAVSLVILFVGLAPMSVAHAQIGPNVPAPLQEPPPPPAPPANQFDDGGLSTLQKALIFGAAVLVLGAIAYVIVRDARRAAPGEGRRHGPSRATERKTAGGAARAARERERQQRAKRAKAKAARNQRKRNRPH